MPENKEISHLVIRIADCVDQLQRIQELLDIAAEEMPPEKSKSLKRVSLMLEFYSESNNTYLCDLLQNLEALRHLLGHPKVNR